MLQAPPRNGQIAPLGQQKIKRLAIAVHGTAEVGPAPFHLDVGLIHSPGLGGRPLSCLNPICHEWRELHHPAVQGGVVNRDAALEQNFFKITVGHGIADVEENRMQDHRLRKVARP